MIQEAPVIEGYKLLTNGQTIPKLTKIFCVCKKETDKRHDYTFSSDCYVEVEDFNYYYLPLIEAEIGIDIHKKESTIIDERYI